MPTCPLSFREKNLTFKDKEIVVTAVTSFLAKHKQSGDVSIDLRRGRGGPCQVLAEELVAERDELSLTLFELEALLLQTFQSLTEADLEGFRILRLRKAPCTDLFDGAGRATDTATQIRNARLEYSLQDFTYPLYNLTELHLVDMKTMGYISSHMGITLPRDIGRLDKLEVLAVENSGLFSLPASIGQISQLRELRLRGNHLKDLPDTCAFCTKLEFLDLSQNHLPALPGFIHRLPNLKKIYRHGNLDFQRTISKWCTYGSVPPSVAGFVQSKQGSNRTITKWNVESLQVTAALAYLSRGVNYWLDPCVPYRLRWLLHSLHSNMCAICNKPQLPESCPGSKGFDVFSIQEVFLGNTNVPFKHWACSNTCAVALRDREAARSYESGKQLRARLQEEDALHRREEERAREGESIHDQGRGGIWNFLKSLFARK